MSLLSALGIHPLQLINKGLGAMGVPFGLHGGGGGGGMSPPNMRFMPQQNPVPLSDTSALQALHQQQAQQTQQAQQAQLAQIAKGTLQQRQPQQITPLQFPNTIMGTVAPLLQPQQPPNPYEDIQNVFRQRYNQ